MIFRYQGYCGRDMLTAEWKTVSNLRRREFITLRSGAETAWPIVIEAVHAASAY
jgi:hypothetical protein